MPCFRSPLHLPLVFGLVLLGGCTVFSQTPAFSKPVTPADAEQAVVAPPSEVTPDLNVPSAKAQYHILAGEVAAGRQQPAIAAQEFLKALAFVPDAKLAGRTTALALAAGDEDLALVAARKWQLIDPTSMDAREVVTRLALRKGLPAEALDECRSIVKDHPGGIDDGFRQVALLLSQEPAHGDESMSIMEQLVGQYPQRSGAYRAKALLAERLGHGEVAEGAARQALKLDPHSREAAMLLAGILVKKGDTAEADTLVDDTLKNDKDSIDARLGYARLLLQANRREAARAQLHKVLSIDPDNGDARLALALLALDEHKFDESESELRSLLKQPDKRMDAEYFLGRLDELRNEPEKALQQYRKVTSGSQALDAQVRSALMLGKLNRIDEARDVFEQLRQQYPPLAGRFYAGEGEMLLDAGKVQEALDVYTTALKMNPDDGDLLYARSLAYERLGKTDLAEADLRKLLQDSPDDARALNALGYMLTVHSTRYDEAQKLIAQALKLTPDDPAVIDSMGWVQFKKGDPKAALPLLQRALSLMPDPEIAAHLGQVLWALGDKDQARAVVSGALKKAPDNTVLQDTLNRMQP